MQIVQWLKDRLKKSSRIHLRSEVASVRDAIAVIDRFIDGKPNYALEWDDFVSWENSVAGVERLRSEIAGMEPMFFSSDKNARLQACKRLIAIRNQYAAFNGIDARGEAVED